MTTPTTRWTTRALALVLVAAALALTVGHLHRAAPEASRYEIRVGGSAVRVEIAADPEARSRGLMYRTELAPDTGMLFVYPGPRRLHFWMKNTPLDLDIGFFDADGRLLNVAAMTAWDERTQHSSHGAARYALEVPRGWFRRHAVPPDARLQIPPGALP